MICVHKSIYCGYLFELWQQVYKSILYCGYSSVLPLLVKAIQISTHNICYYKEVDNIILTAI